MPKETLREIGRTRKNVFQREREREKKVDEKNCRKKKKIPLEKMLWVSWLVDMLQGTVLIFRNFLLFQSYWKTVWKHWSCHHQNVSWRQYNEESRRIEKGRRIYQSSRGFPIMACAFLRWKLGLMVADHLSVSSSVSKEQGSHWKWWLSDLGYRIVLLKSVV